MDDSIFNHLIEIANYLLDLSCESNTALTSDEQSELNNMCDDIWDIIYNHREE